MKLLVIGCGSIGERHIRNIRSLGIDTILACDTNQKRLMLMKNQYKIETFENVDEALDQSPDAVLICTHPVLHIPLGIKAINYNTHVFMEKPLSNTLKNVDKFLDEAHKKKRKILVGYNLRFHPGIKLMKKLLDENAIGRVLSTHVEFGQYLPDWRPLQDYRKSYTARSALGGGIILDASHEIDYITWLLGSITQLTCFAEKVSSLKVNVEDNADILVRFTNNIIGHIHLDFVQRQYSRNCKIIGEKGTITWDYAERQVKLYIADKKQTKIHSFMIESNQMYIEEMKHFLAYITGRTKPLITVEQAKKVLEVALAAKKSAKTGKMIHL